MAISSTGNDETPAQASLTHVQPNASPEVIVDLLNRDGGLIVDDVIPVDHLSKIRAELAPHIEATKTGRLEFAGYETRRLGALMARSPACRDLAMHPLVHAACTRFLEPYCDSVQLHFTQAVSIGPGQGVLLHYAPSWLRQEENQYLLCPPEVAQDLDPELRALLGYSKGGPILGFFSTPGGPGEGVEIAPPEYLFGAKEIRHTGVSKADDLIKATKRGIRNARPD
jgi:hypothetical protein